MTREMVREYEVDYQAQIGLNLSYLLNKEEEEEMTMEKWYEGLTDQEKDKIEDIVDNFTIGNPIEERVKYKNKVVERKYNEYLKDIEESKKEEELKKQREIEEEQQYQKDLDKGIATIELYESNKYRCWAAEITGTDSKFGFAREFMNPVKVQGNYKIYELEEGKLYNYLNDNQQHFVKVVNSRLVEITKDEMESMVG